MTQKPLAALRSPRFATVFAAGSLLFCGVPLGAHQTTPATPCPATPLTKKQKLAALINSARQGKPATSTDAPKPECPPAANDPATASPAATPPAPDKPVDTPDTAQPAQSVYISKPQPTATSTAQTKNETATPQTGDNSGSASAPKLEKMPGKIIPNANGGMMYSDDGYHGYPVEDMGEKAGIHAYKATQNLSNGLIVTQVYYQQKDGSLTGFTLKTGGKVAITGIMKPDPTARVNRTGNDGYVDPKNPVPPQGLQPDAIFSGDGIILETPAPSARMGNESVSLYYITFPGEPANFKGSRYYMRTVFGSKNINRPNREFLEVNASGKFAGVVLREETQNNRVAQYHADVPK